METRLKLIPLCRPSITDSEVEAVVEMLRSGWLTTGAHTLDFEERFRTLIGTDAAIAMSSGTAAMHAVLHCLGIGPGDEVITPSLTWVSTVNLIELAGATPVFADVDQHDLMCRPEHIAPLISSHTRAIVPVHFAGAACDVDAIQDVVGKRPIEIVEDAAHAVGTQINGNQVGSSYTSVFSFHAIKNLTTGEGGMVCTNKPLLADRLRQVKFHGLAVDAFDREAQGRKAQAMVMEPGYKYNMTDMCAALGLAQLERIEAMNLKRQLLARHYLQRLEEIEGVQPLFVPSQSTHAWHLMVVRITQAGVTREQVMTYLKERGIGSGIHFIPVHTHPFYQRRYGRQPHLVHSEWNGKRIVSLPLFPDLELGDVDRICDVLARAVNA